MTVRAQANGLFLALASLLVAAAANAAPPAYPEDGVVEADIKGHWPSAAKVLEMKKSGQWTTQTVTNDEGKKVTQAYLNYDVRTEKDGTIRKTGASARYWLVEGAWVFKAVGLGESKAEGRADRPAPEKPAIKEKIKAAVEGNKLEDFAKLYFMAGDPLKLPLKVSKVLVTDPEYLDAGESYGFKYVFDVEAVDAAGRKVLVSDMSYTVRKKAAGTGDWEERMGVTGISKGTYQK